MAEYRYRVIRREGRGELRDRGSRFAAWAGAVRNEDEAGARRDEFARLYPDASHHCWARRLGSPPRERSADDGEPSGTAGMPILQVLRGARVSDSMALVARWFGGTKLGKGGLARAYAGAAREALDAATLGERLLYEELRLIVPYERFGDLKRLVHPPEVELTEPVYGEVVTCVLRVVPPRRAEVVDQLAALSIVTAD